MSRPVLPPVKVGDTLIRRTRNNEREVEVTRVGRKYLFVKLYGREFPYLLDTGYAKEGNGYAVDRVATREMLDAEQRRRDLMARLQGLGWERKRGYRDPEESIETLEAMVALLEADATSL